MLRRTLPYVVGAIVGFCISWGGQRPVFDSDGVFDMAAYQQCESMKGTRENTALRQRTVAKRGAPDVPGVTDWVFMAYCDGAPVPTVRIHRPQAI